MNSLKLAEKISSEAQDILLTAIRDFIESTNKSWNYILPTELKKLIDSGKTEDLFLLDVRKPEDYRTGHIKNSVNIFWLNLFKDDNLKKLPKDKKIIVICYVGHTASQIMTLLRLLGYNAIALKFGMGIAPDPNIPVKGWLKYNYPIEKGKTASERPLPSEVQKIIEYYAFDMMSGQLNAPINIQNRFREKLNKFMDKLKNKYPNIDMQSESFYQQIQHRAESWWNKRLMKGTGVDW